MAILGKFESFVTAMAEGTHKDALNEPDTDTLKLVLTLDPPVLGSNTVLANLSTLNEPTGTGYTAGGTDALNTASTSGGTITVGATSNPSWTATDTDWDDFRYVTLYNSTPAGGPLIMAWDYESDVSLGSGETFTVNVTTNYFTVA